VAVRQHLYLEVEAFSFAWRWRYVCPRWHSGSTRRGTILPNTSCHYKNDNSSAGVARDRNRASGL